MIIVMAIAVLPMLSVGGMQLFRTESFETADKVIPGLLNCWGYFCCLHWADDFMDGYAGRCGCLI